MRQDDISLQEEDEGIPAFASLFFYIFTFLVLCGIFSGIVYFLLGEPVDANGALKLPQYSAFQFATLLSAVLPALFILKNCDRRPLSDLGLSIRGHVKDTLLGLLMAVLLFGIGFGISYALGVIKVTGIQLDIYSLGISFVLCVMIAFTEEIMMRGYVLGRLLRTRMNKFLALLISSVLFALFHILNPNIAFLPILNLILAGCLLGASYLYTHNLWFPISLHLFWNWIQGPVLGYEVSGIALCPSLVKLYLPENNILNGGTFGFEGSIICTALMILFTGGIIWYFEKKKV